MYKPMNYLNAIVKSDVGNLEKAINAFSDRDFYTIKIPSTDNFLICGLSDTFKEKLGYDPEKNTGAIPNWAKELISEINYTVSGPYINRKDGHLSSKIGTTIGLGLL